MRARRQKNPLPILNWLQHWVYHANGDVGADVTHMVPILILFIKMLVLRQVRIVQIERKRIGKLIGKLLKRQHQDNPA